MSNRNPAESDLDRFRELQGLAYRAAEHVASRLEPGVTERMATKAMRRWLERHGVDDWFHVPFAWFGDRTTFGLGSSAPWLPHRFLPTGRRLEEGMPFVLDCAPVMDGYVADIGYGGVLGENLEWDAADRALAGYRDFILDQVRGTKPDGARRTFQEIYRNVDERIAADGYANRHKVYPGRVIGHQVGRIRVGGPRVVMGFSFGLRTLRTIGRDLIFERLEGRSPLWADGRSSAHPPTPGLWAVEPHIGKEGGPSGPGSGKNASSIGIKFEEILVVTEDDAYWLDDDLPHVRRWRSRAVEPA